MSSSAGNRKVAPRLPRQPTSVPFTRRASPCMWIFLALAVGGGLAFGAGRWMMASREPVRAPREPWGSGSAFLATRSGRVHYLDEGAGPVLLLLHGSGRSLADWQEGTAQLLARRHRVVAFDYYGNGLSDRAHGWRCGSPLWAQQGIDVLDALGIERATVVGHSIGGVVAALMAADHPNRVEAVVTIGTGMAIAPAQIPLLVPGLGEFLMGRTEVFGDTYSEQHRARTRSGYQIAGTRAALLTYIRRQYTIDGLRLLTGVWEDIRAPILHVSGSEDEQIPTATAERLARRSGGTFVRIDGVRHDVHILAPERLVREIERFLDRQVFQDRARPSGARTGWHTRKRCSLPRAMRSGNSSAHEMTRGLRAVDPPSDRGRNRLGEEEPCVVLAALRRAAGVRHVRAGSSKPPGGRTMKNTKNALVMLCALLVAGGVAAADPVDPTAPVWQFIDAFNRGDIKAAEETHVAEPIIIDEVPPYQWQGRDSFKTWLGDLTKNDTAAGVTDGHMTLGDVIRREVTGDHAYVVAATDYSFKLKGTPMHEASQMTFALRKEKAGWRIVGWTFAGPKPVRSAR